MLQGRSRHCEINVIYKLVLKEGKSILYCVYVGLSLCISKGVQVFSINLGSMIRACWGESLFCVIDLSLAFVNVQ